MASTCFRGAPQGRFECHLSVVNVRSSSWPTRTHYVYHDAITTPTGARQDDPLKLLSATDDVDCIGSDRHRDIAERRHLNEAGIPRSLPCAGLATVPLSIPVGATRNLLSL